jgi:hypothetical protein
MSDATRRLEELGIADLSARFDSERGLVPMPDTADARRLLHMVDPYSYRDRLTLPKLIINGANDPYWTVDSLNLYWNELTGDKWVLYIPNAKHELEEETKTGLDRVSRGTARTMLEHAAGLRGAGAVRTFDLGTGPVTAVRVPWADVFTAPRSTGVADVSTYLVAGAAFRVLLEHLPLRRRHHQAARGRRSPR